MDIFATSAPEFLEWARDLHTSAECHRDPVRGWSGPGFVQLTVTVQMHSIFKFKFGRPVLRVQVTVDLKFLNSA